jgi:hypothetical protein
VFGVRFPSVTTAVMVPLLAPEVGELRLNHDPLQLTDADQFRVPPPVLLTVTVLLAGLLPPCTAVKVNDMGLNPIAGDGGFTVSVTATVCGVLVAPAAETWMLQL